jgi:hypothetical protein
MDESTDQKRPVARTPRWLTGVLIVVTYAIGLYGLYLTLPAPSPLSLRYWLDLLFDDLQLYVINYSPPPGVTESWFLEVARFAAPATTVLAVVAAASRSFRSRLSWTWRRIRKGQYAVVVGDTPEAFAIASAKRSDGKKVYQIGDGDIFSLRTAGVVGAAGTLYAFANDRQDVEANVAIALAAASLRKPGKKLRINVHVTDPDLALGLKARRLMAPANDQTTIDFVSMDEQAALAYIDQDRPDPDHPAILVAGAGVFGKSIIVAYARSWRDHSGRAGTKAPVTLIDRHAQAAMKELYEHYPVVREMCDISAFDRKLTDFLAAPATGPFRRSYICYEDEHDALTVALAATPLWRGGERSIVVRLSRLAQHGEAFTDSRLDNIDKRLVMADVANLASVRVARDPDPVQDLAPTVHANYLSGELARGEKSAQDPSMLRWEDLSADLQQSNRAQVADFANKLGRLGCTIAPRSARNVSFDLTDDEIEAEAVREHDRWMAQRREAGWTYGKPRDNKKKKHPALLPWGELDEEDRDRDREAVRNLLYYDKALGDVGLQIVRLT